MTCRPYDSIIPHKGYHFGVRTEPDYGADPPWDRCDGHGRVSDWTTRDKAPGERVIAVDYPHQRYYDIKAALRIACKDGWGVEGGQRPGESARSYAARAVEADYQYLKAWCEDRWSYVGVIVEQCTEGGEPLGPEASLWGVETSDDYDQTVALELMDELMAQIEVTAPDAVLSEN